MPRYQYAATFEQSADVIFDLLTEVEHHDRILPFCKSVTVQRRRTTPEGKSEVALRHLMAIQRINLETDVRSILLYRKADLSIEMVSHLDQGGGCLAAVGKVTSDGTASQLHLSLDISGLPLRYRLLLVEPVLRRAHVKLVDKISRRAAEVAPVSRAAL
jgi:ribosome-associated toxin RatA of RatAB toxin-antitoxin module